MSPEVSSSYEDIAKLSAQVRLLYENLEVRIREASDLEKMLLLCTNINEVVNEFSSCDLLRLIKAKRVLDAIISCSNENKGELKEPLKRISENSLETSTDKHSLGKDALYELELLQYIKHRGLNATLGEPDIIVCAPFGKYYIACKTINSLNNFEKQLQSGYHQLEKYGDGVGCIAFNLEPYMVFSEPLEISSPKEASFKLREAVQKIINDKRFLIHSKLIEGRFDGVIFQMTCIVKINSNETSYDTFTHSYFYCDSQEQSNDAYKRFSGFVNSMKGSLVEYIDRS